MFEFSLWSVVSLLFAIPPASQTAPATQPIPPHYREWIFLSSGMDMAYLAPKSTAGPAHSSFDNVFVDPEAYRRFVESGTWPDDTTLVLEIRSAESNASINKAGRTQGSHAEVELHSKVHGEWAFYAGDEHGVAHLIQKPAGCYSCHEQHAAVDTTFVQFYPTLLPIAEQKKTLSPAYLHERDEASRGVR